MNKPKGLRRLVKDGPEPAKTAAVLLDWLRVQEWARPEFERWLRRKAQA